MTKFSILGYGEIGKVHHQAISNSHLAQLVAIIDLELETGLEEKTYTALESFLQEDTETDIVVIATPNGLHFEHAIRCLKAGKNILVEMPIAFTVDETEEILAIAKEKNLRVFSTMQLRFSPVVQYVKKLIDNNAFGEIFMVNVQSYINRNKNYYKLKDWRCTDEMAGSVLFNQFANFIDVLNYWFDDLKCSSSESYNFSHQNLTEFNDSGYIDFLANGIRGNMVYTTSIFNKSFESNITIIAEKGTIKIGNQYLNELIYSDIKNVCCSKNVSTTNDNFFTFVIDEVSDALMRHNPSILDGENALGLVKFISDTDQLTNTNCKKI